MCVNSIKKTAFPKKSGKTQECRNKPYGSLGQKAFFGSIAPDNSAGFLALNSLLYRAFSQMQWLLRQAPRLQ
jgi:hypothetical protein